MFFTVFKGNGVWRKTINKALAGTNKVLTPLDG